jgi:two-component system response regulator
MTHQQVEILLVEDNARDMELTLHALRRGNLANDVAVVRDGEEALDFIFGRGKFKERNTDHQPRLVLLDLKLPKVDGMEVLRELKSNAATRAIPVVVLTSSREQQDLVNSYQLGVNAFIQKPVDFESFRDTVKQVGLFWLVVNRPPPDAAFQQEHTS